MPGTYEVGEEEDEVDKSATMLDRGSESIGI